MKLLKHSNFLLLEIPKASKDAHFINHFLNHYLHHNTKLHENLTLYPGSLSAHIHTIFYYWIKARQASTDAKTLHLLQTNQLPLKLCFNEKKEHNHPVSISILRNHAGQLCINVASKYPHLRLYIQSYFNAYMVKPFHHEDALVISLESSLAVKKLSNLLRRNDILGFVPYFHYNKNDINKLFNNKHFETKHLSQHLSCAYKLLGSHPFEPLDVIKKRYKKLIVTYHPDRVYTQSDHVIKNYTSKFQSLQNAYACIKAAKLAS